jgi:hypothetical protein
MRKALTTAMLTVAAIAANAGSAVAAPNPPQLPNAPKTPKSGSFSAEYEYAASSEEKSILNLTNPLAPAFDLVTVNGEERQSMATSGDIRGNVR